MKAICWNGVNDVRVETVPDPHMLNPRDAIIRVKATTICGSDLHLYDGYIPSMEKGDILGHEFMGEVVEVGSAVKNLRTGDRVVVPSVISCGNCFHCRQGQFSLCDNSNPNPMLSEKLWGQCPCGIFGYSHMMGGYAGSHAEYIRVPFADVGPRKIPDGISDEKALFISDAVPTGFMAADFCNIQRGDTIAVWGCGAVGLFAIRSAYLLGAERVIAIDRLPERLVLARERFGAEVLDYTKVNVVEALKELTAGRGPDACIDAVGMEAHEVGLEGAYDRVKQAVRLETERPYVLREAIQSCRKGGLVSVIGVYGGLVDKFPMGAAMNKGLTFRMAQMHAQRYLDRLLEYVQRGELDPSIVATHRMPLSEGPRAYEMFKHKTDGCVRVVLMN
ncbi:zinc-dependent alcohol dehydrogenase [Hyalangium gracile]|uniref:zinc-dependent alcohol dehydrogenase n=1 Tax=Hyalangium gracile TaxID=394092 RepID=UPI001CCAF31B|nr:zinc-dependent alcohol dehydrogenase [Hyalangium gracile]